MRARVPLEIACPSARESESQRCPDREMRAEDSKSARWVARLWLLGQMLETHCGGFVEGRIGSGFEGSSFVLPWAQFAQAL